MKKIKVAVVGVGNCASSLIQGIEYYHNYNSGKKIIGLINNTIGGYKISDIEVVAAFDVDENKVGKDLSEAIITPPNNTKIFSQVKKTGVIVQNAQVYDGIGKYLKDVIKPSKQKIPNPKEIIRKSQAEILINYLPVGSQLATEYWTNICLETHTALINCIPVFIASDKKWSKKFKRLGIPVIGDDIKSQIGATIVHRTLTNLFMDRGMPLDRTYQLNIGGNTDFQNMLERERLASKKLSKTRSVTSQIVRRGESFDPENVHIGPSDYVPFMHDNKVAYIRMEGRHFGDVPMNLEVRLSVEDSPNSAGVVVDAIRCCKLALDHKIGGALSAPSAYLMKSPPEQSSDDEAKKNFDDFIRLYQDL
ncbi:inositol-3-phosphate synthase [Candidatus Gottesmanbacteria bacterium RIFCSPHIGHO2_02_FULL_40_13]|uniref:Inositol-3-phosphate synthase n=1 Tax=Candidatus Gottesmanbacteria bacterium RIFCSPHIGHO2_02_FULL_40_13 TaxID=1798384 RepID=A0A1F6A6G8_9BACT|nr:MAG: inositol-3-phosphate synthase [Candidatus Gottesmanbacteria bacterium RIFCSPHIGHO2_02_FULL_40_13]